MQKFLIDMHSHTTYSYDGRNTPEEMLSAALKKGIAFYGVSEHFDYDYDLSQLPEEERCAIQNRNLDECFHALRHLQEDYEGVMNFVIGAEFGFSEQEEVKKRYLETYEKYRPDYVINSVHGCDGKDFYRYEFKEDKQTVYRMYLRLVRESLDVPYHYDIVGHLGYIARYVPFEDNTLGLEEFGKEIDDILLTIIRKNKILEVNSANKNLANRTLPAEPILARYFELGGRNVSFGSDAHLVERIGDKWEEAVSMLKKIGFTHLTVPFRGEYYKVKL